MKTSKLDPETHQESMLLLHEVINHYKRQYVANKYKANSRLVNPDLQKLMHTPKFTTVEGYEKHIELFTKILNDSRFKWSWINMGKNLMKARRRVLSNRRDNIEFYTALSELTKVETNMFTKQKDIEDFTALLNYKPNDVGIAEFKAKVEKLKSEGIEIISYQQKYILSYIDFMRSMTSDWYRVARHNLMDMTRNLFHQDQITIAVQNEKVIGYCQFEGSHFGPFGVADSHQGKGIGTILLGRTLEKMRMYGFHDAWVLWTDDLAAKVYSKFGFKETRRFVVFKKEL